MNTKRDADITERYARGERTACIAADYGVTMARIRQIANKAGVRRVPWVSSAPVEKFLSYLPTDVPPVDGCWEWPEASTNSHGYGQFRARINGRMVSTAHRASWLLFKGKIGDMWVLHTCDNRRCVNPSHLYLGTHADNMRDRDRRNRTRAPVGEKNGVSVLTRAEVVEIRKAYAAGGVTHKELGERFGVTGGTILHVVRRLTWKHVP